MPSLRVGCWHSRNPCLSTVIKTRCCASLTHMAAGQACLPSQSRRYTSAASMAESHAYPLLLIRVATRRSLTWPQNLAMLAYHLLLPPPCVGCLHGCVPCFSATELAHMAAGHTCLPYIRAVATCQLLAYSCLTLAIFTQVCRLFVYSSYCQSRCCVRVRVAPSRIVVPFCRLIPVIAAHGALGSLGWLC